MSDEPAEGRFYLNVGEKEYSFHAMVDFGKYDNVISTVVGRIVVSLMSGEDNE